MPNRARWSRLLQRTCALSMLGLVAGSSGTYAAPLLKVAGPFDYNDTPGNGYIGGHLAYLPGASVNPSGVAVGYAGKVVAGSTKGNVAVRWDASGTASLEMANLGADNTGSSYSYPYAINASGTAVGYGWKYVGGSYQGKVPIRWSAIAGTATELATLGGGDARAFAINDTGTIVGYSARFSNEKRAVRWAASGTSVTMLGTLGTTPAGTASSEANAINHSGVSAGYSEKYTVGVLKGRRAVRWAASGTAAIELDNLGFSSTGSTDSLAYAINDSGTCVGISSKYVSGVLRGHRAVRWDSTGTTATELGTLGTDSSGSTTAFAYAVNASGTAVGYGDKYVSGVTKGWRAIRWDASGTAATELGVLGTEWGTGNSWALAVAVNGAGTAVGRSYKYVGLNSLGDRAVVWSADSSAAIDLNDLGIVNVPTGGTWLLTSAAGMSEDGWTSGEGRFDPDGTGPRGAYNRLWVGQIGLGGNWRNTTGINHTWGRGSNWSTGTPAIQLDARFSENRAYTVAFDRDEACRSIFISAGTVNLAMAGHSLKVSDQFSIASGTAVRSGGTIIGNVISAGQIQPENGGLSIAGNLSLQSGAGFTFSLGSTPTRIDLVGGLHSSAPGSHLVFHFTDTGDFEAGEIYDMMTFSSTTNITVGDLSFTSDIPGFAGHFILTPTTLQIATVPEPASMATVSLVFAVFVHRFRPRIPSCIVSTVR